MISRQAPRLLRLGINRSSPPPELWTIQKLLRWTAEHFTHKQIDSPRLTAEVLLAHALATTRLRLYIDFERPVEATELTRFRELIRQRSQGIPTQHLAGGRDFYGRWFSIDRRAFIPRPETELLVEACLAALPGDGAGVSTLDLCAGSGCVGLTLLAERSALRLSAVELSPEACAVAQANAKALGLEDRYQLHQGDLFAPLPNGHWDLIVANPPYVPTGEIAGLAVEVRDHDPRLALDGGIEGLDVIRRLVGEGVPRLSPGGQLAFEIDESQGPAVRELLGSAGLKEIEIGRDHAGHDRLATARR